MNPNLDKILKECVEQLDDMTEEEVKEMRARHEEYVSLNFHELDELENTPIKQWDKIIGKFYRVRNVLDDIRRSVFSIKKLKQGWFLLKFWLRYYPYDFAWGIELLLWDIDNLIENYKECEDYYIGQEKDLRNLIILRECIDRIYVKENLTNTQYKEVQDLMFNKLKKSKGFWI